MQSRRWTWLAGAQTADFPASFGPIGIETSTAIPSGRLGTAYAYHSETDSMYVFGGMTDIGNWNRASMCDFWRYNLRTNRWTFLGGSQVHSLPGNYGVMGMEAASNWPGARRGATFGYDEATQSLVLFGGRGVAGQAQEGNLNDVWSFSFVTGYWSFLSGTNITNYPGDYSSKQVPSSSNYPMGRYESIGFWHPQRQSLYFVGGTIEDTSAFINDMWSCKLDLSRIKRA
jgi:hypothetical protein